MVDFAKLLKESRERKAKLAALPPLENCGIIEFGGSSEAPKTAEVSAISRPARQEIDLDDPTLEGEELPSDVDPVTQEFSFLTGSAGTGKTHYWREKIKEDPLAARLCATTGIAAVNLDTVTLHSILKYSDTESLMDSFIHGYLHTGLRKLAKDGYKALVIDEVSMLDARQLDLIVTAVKEIGLQGVKLDLCLTGDFCQLPPVKAPYAFEAECWPLFEDNTTRLTKNWRQSDQRFLDGLTALRRGDGPAGSEILKECKVPFASGLNVRFDGTTIFGKNDEVGRFNSMRLQLLAGKSVLTHPERAGVQRNEWKQERGLIPDPLVVKDKALVMLLVNDTTGGYSYANGDLGWVESYDPKDDVFQIKLVRNDRVVRIGKFIRYNFQREQPEPHEIPVGFTPYKRGKLWVVGEIHYHPMRLGWATTCHKSQGLSLDRVQVDLGGSFLGQPGMVYVALSRCRTPQGLRLIGSVETLAKRCKVDPKVVRWL